MDKSTLTGSPLRTLYELDSSLVLEGANSHRYCEVPLNKKTRDLPVSGSALFRNYPVSMPPNAEVGLGMFQNIPLKATSRQIVLGIKEAWLKDQLVG